jgi:hypothetical protein
MTGHLNLGYLVPSIELLEHVSDYYTSWAVRQYTVYPTDTILRRLLSPTSCEANTTP